MADAIPVHKPATPQPKKKPARPKHTPGQAPEPTKDGRPLVEPPTHAPSGGPPHPGVELVKVLPPYKPHTKYKLPDGTLCENH